MFCNVCSVQYVESELLLIRWILTVFFLLFCQCGATPLLLPNDTASGMQVMYQLYVGRTDRQCSQQL